MALTVIAAYDVSEDGRRSRLAALLQSIGDRLQKSVFLLSLTAQDLTLLQQRAAALIDPETDSLYFMRQCADCWNDLECLGQAQPPKEVLYWTAL